MKWRVKFTETGIKGELNFHGGTDLGKNWYIIPEKRPKDLPGRTQNAFIYITPDAEPSTVPPTVDTWGTIFVNGHWVDEHDPNSFEKVVFLPDVTEARMYDRRDNRGMVRPAWVYDLHLSDQVMEPTSPTQHIRVAVRKSDYPS